MADKRPREERINLALFYVARIGTHLADVQMGAPMPGEAATDIKDLHALIDELWKEDRGRAP